jgi:gamma-glutamyltranspeptidase/glutathione hydrolase
MKYRITTLVAAMLAVSACQPQQQEVREPEAATGFQQKQSVKADEFMVAAANPHAVEAGYNVLKAGGSAIDAAIAVQAMLGLVEPQSSGIGGGAFILYWDNEAKNCTPLMLAKRHQWLQQKSCS